MEFGPTEYYDDTPQSPNWMAAFWAHRLGRHKMAQAICSLPFRSNAHWKFMEGAAMCNCCGTKAEKRLADAMVAYSEKYDDWVVPHRLSAQEWKDACEATRAVIAERKPKERWTTGPSLGLPGWSVFCGGTWNCSFAMTVDAEAYARYKNRTQP